MRLKKIYLKLNLSLTICCLSLFLVGWVQASSQCPDKSFRFFEPEKMALYFPNPKKTRVISLFAGEGKSELAIAKKLGLNPEQMTVVDIKPFKDPKGFIHREVRDVFELSKQKKYQKRFDRVLLINPGMPPSLTKSLPNTTRYDAVADQVAADWSRYVSDLSESMSDKAFKTLSEEDFDQYYFYKSIINNFVDPQFPLREIVYRDFKTRIKVLFASIDAAMPFLKNEGGEILLLTERVHTVPTVSSGMMSGTILFASDWYEQAITRAFEVYYPGWSISENRMGLKNILWPSRMKLTGVPREHTKAYRIYRK